MPPPIAAIIFVAGIVCLFMLEEKPKGRASWALWLPTVWLLVAGSRPVSAWFGATPQGSIDQYLEGSPLDRNIYALMLGGGISVLVTRRAAVLRILRRNWPLVLFVAYCAVSVIWSDFPAVALKRWIKSLGDYVMVFILLTERDVGGAVKQVLARVGFVLLPVSVLLIKYYPEWGRSYALHWEGTQFFTGAASDKNMLGMACLVFGFASVWRVLEAWQSSRRDRTRAIVAHGTIVVMAIWLLRMCNSMTSLACFGLTSALIAAHTFLRVARKGWFVQLSVAAIILVCASVLFFDVGTGLLTSMGRNPTLTGRTDIWDTLLQVRTNQIVGTGFESFWLGQRLERLWRLPELYGINEAHNGYLEMYLNLGWIGVVLFGTLLWAGFRNVMRLIVHDPSAGRLRLGYLVIAVVYNFTEAAVRSTSLVWIATLLASVSVPESNRIRSAAGKARLRSSPLTGSEQALVGPPARRAWLPAINSLQKDNGLLART